MQVVSSSHNRLFHIQKRIIHPLFFCIFGLIVISYFNNVFAKTFTPDSTVLKKALDEKLFDETHWLALLHINNGNIDIEDKNFYIDHHFTNAKDEFVNSFTQFFINNNQSEKCRFPARFNWMASKLEIAKKVTLGNCPEYDEYLTKVPIDTVSLVFGAEDISIPASMMGHVFLKLDGKKPNGDQLNHAISFYTNTSDVSFIDVFIKSFFTGMKGYYTLSPYHVYKNNYLYNEQRNVWEYSLQLNKSQINLLQSHLYELKNIRFKYLFHSYNCATFIHGLLNVVFPDEFARRSSWITPLDVIRASYEKKITSSITVYPSSKWKIAALIDSFKLNSKNIDLIKDQQYEKIILDKDTTEEEKIAIWELAKSYNHYLAEDDVINREEWNKHEKLIEDKKNEINSKAVIDLTQYKVPHKTIKSAQVILTTESRNNEKILRIGHLPLSHSLSEDNSQYISESSLKMGELHFAYNINQHKIKLDELNLYSIATYNPSNKILSPISWKFSIGYAPKWQIDNQITNAYYIQGGLGKTYRLNADIDIYGFANIEATQKNTFNLNIGPELGLIIREIESMKSIVSVNRDYFIVSTKTVNRLNLTQAINFNSHTFNLTLSKNIQNNNQSNDYSLIYKFLY